MMLRELWSSNFSSYLNFQFLNAHVAGWQGNLNWWPAKDSSGELQLSIGERWATAEHWQKMSYKVFSMLTSKSNMVFLLLCKTLMLQCALLLYNKDSIPSLVSFKLHLHVKQLTDAYNCCVSLDATRFVQTWNLTKLKTSCNHFNKHILNWNITNISLILNLLINFQLLAIIENVSAGSRYFLKFYFIFNLVLTQTSSLEIVFG